MTRSIAQLVSRSRARLQNPFAHLDSEGGYDAVVDGGNKTTALIGMAKVLKDHSRGSLFTRQEIESVVRNLHTEMWRRRAEIFQSEDEVEPLRILDPALALRCLGYEVVMRESLGQHSAGRDSFEVAGIVDKLNEKVEISRRFAPAIRNFTTAHELGHAVLHEGSGLHRDRGLDGASIGRRDPREMEADIFASCFLLPEKQLRSAFKTRFLTEKFRLTDATVFALHSGSLRDLQKRCRSERDLARILAAAQQYNGAHRKSLAERFGVSVEVMAIRIEELDLVTLD